MYWKALPPAEHRRGPSSNIRGPVGDCRSLTLQVAAHPVLSPITLWIPLVAKQQELPAPPGVAEGPPTKPGSGRDVGEATVLCLASAWRVTR